MKGSLPPEWHVKLEPIGTFFHGGQHSQEYPLYV